MPEDEPQGSTMDQSARSSDQSTSSFPFDRLPVELAEMIFSAYLPKRKLSPPGWKDPKDSPTILCMVSKQWQSVAHRCPSLWATLYLTKKQWEHLDYVRCWILRSKNCLLSIGVYQDETDVGYNLELLRPVWNLLLSESKRWKEVDLQLNKLVEMPRGECPNLTSLNVALPSDMEGLVARPGYLQQILENGPYLRDAQFSMAACTGFVLSPRFPQTQLVELYIDARLTSQEYLMILKNSPSLVSCELDSLGGPESPHNTVHQQGQVTLAHLQRLDFLTGIDPAPILPFLTAPVLDWLNISSQVMGGNTAGTALSQFLLRSRPPLRVLYLDCNFSPTQLSDCLCSVPVLEDLTIFDPSFAPFSLTSAAVEILSRRPDGSFLCPRLTEISLDYRVPVIDGAFSRLVEERFGQRAEVNGVAALTNVHIQFAPGPRTHDSDHLQALLDRGLAVSFSISAN